LGGLFSLSQCPDISRVKLGNKALMGAIFNLSWMRDDASKSLVRVNWKDMGPEEFGSVYESLLELVPDVSSGGRVFDLKTVAGNERKTTGSYYTPDSLVKLLLDSALEPVIKKAIDSNPADPVKALLQLTVIDPSCGSGHFLIAAAHRIASHVARLSVDGTPTSSDYAHALRQVITHCIFGTDLNPMALELAKMALWLEAHTPDTPLGFLDHHLVLGNALLGLVSPEDLKQGIPEKAYSPRTGDDKDLCASVKATNRTEARSLQALMEQSGQRTLGGMEFTLPTNLFEELEGMPDDTLEAIKLKRQKLEELRQSHDSEGVALAMDLYMAAFLMRKTASTAAEDIPTTRDVTLALRGEPVTERKVQNAQKVCRAARLNHWPITFPQVFARGGFSCVLGNPPWERIKLQEQEFFAARSQEIATAANKAARDRAIKKLEQAEAGTWEANLFEEFVRAKHEAESTSEFCHGPRYPLSGRGDVNTYALFAETIYQITNFQNGRAGFIVPTGIATDDSTKFYFAEVSQKGKLVSLIDFENREKIFPGIDSRIKFSLLTLGNAREAKFSFFLTNVSQVQDERRQFTLTPEEFALINPNTKTCPVFRTKMDAELTKKIYRRVPVLLKEAVVDQGKIIERELNPWGISFGTMFHMSNDSHLFYNEPGDGRLPLYEAKMIHQFDHRWATYEEDGTTSRDCTIEEKQRWDFEPRPRYWIDQIEVERVKKAKNWDDPCLLCFRDITNATNERTFISSFVPPAGLGNKGPVLKPNVDYSEALILMGVLNSLAFDFVVRQKIGGTTMNFFYVKQFPVLTPDLFNDSEKKFITKRIKSLISTSNLIHDALSKSINNITLTKFCPESRATMRAEIDAVMAKKFGLTRSELRYILNPKEVMGESYPSESFTVLMNNELREFGEYRTSKTLLKAWDKFYDEQGNQTQPFEETE
jgi:hypothetical protein